VQIIKRNNCIYATLATLLFFILYSTLHTSHPHRITSAKCHTNTVVSLDDGHIVVRNMYRKEVDMLRKILHQVGLIYKNIRFLEFSTCIRENISSLISEHLSVQHNMTNTEVEK